MEFFLNYAIKSRFFPAVTFQHNTQSSLLTHCELIFLLVLLSLQSSQENVVRVLQELLILIRLAGAVKQTKILLRKYWEHYINIVSLCICFPLPFFNTCVCKTTEDTCTSCFGKTFNGLMIQVHCKLTFHENTFTYPGTWKF